MKLFFTFLLLVIYAEVKSAIPLLDFKVERRCLGDSTLFTDLSCCNINLWIWDFGDPASGAANTAYTKTAKHKYNTTGTYTVTLRLGNGSISDTIVKQVVICVPEKPILSFHDTTICEGNKVSLYSLNTFDDYYWNIGDTNRVISINTSGTYVLCGTNCDSTCLVCDTAKVNVISSPEAQLGKYNSTCSLDSFQLNARNPGFKYLWNTGDSTQKIWVKKDGWYFVKIYNSKCFIFDSTYITFSKKQILEFKTDTGGCEGDTLYLNPGWKYKEVWWNYTDTNHVLKVFQTGIYPLRVIYQGCLIDTYAMVNFISPTAFKLPNDTILCQGDTLLVATSLTNVKYYWSNGDTTSYTKIFKSDTIRLTVNFGGCYQTDTIIVKFIDLPIVPTIPKVFTCNSLPGTISVNVEAGNSFKWWDGNGNKTRNFPDSGWHHFEISNSCFSIQDSAYTGFFPENPADTSTHFEICFEDDTVLILTAKPSSSYLWKPGNQNQQSIVVNKYGWYSVTLMDSVGCRRIDSFEVLKKCTKDTIFVPNAFSPNADGKNDIFKPTFVRHTFYEFSVFNRWGELVFKTNDIYEGWDGTYYQKPAQEDVYIYIIDVSGYGVFRQLKGTVHLIR